MTMLEFFLESIEDGIARYSYVPFRDESFRGFVRVNASDGAVVDFELSGHPYDYNPSVCVGKILGRLEEFARAGEYEGHGFVVWG